MPVDGFAFEPTSVCQMPEAVRAVLAPAATLAASEAETRRLTRDHYENFSVVAFVLPRHLRQDFCNVYAFCRVADDLGDASETHAAALRSLAQLGDQTEACYRGHNQSALFTALSTTIQRHAIPIDPFLDLISAFEQDQHVRRYETFAQLLDYCRRSANPVGRLVLYMCGYRDEQRQHLSDQTCSALQLANFWQDVKRDLIDLDRIYIPAESMRRFGVDESQLRQGRCDDAFRALIRFEVDRTAAMFDQGEQLLPLLNNSIRPQIGLFGRGGRAILKAIRDQHYDTLSRRPVLSTWQKGRLVLAAMIARMGWSRGWRTRV